MTTEEELDELRAIAEKMAVERICFPEARISTAYLEARADNARLRTELAAAVKAKQAYEGMHDTSERARYELGEEFRGLKAELAARGEGQFEFWTIGPRVGNYPVFSHRNDAASCAERNGLRVHRWIARPAPEREQEP